MSDTLLRDASVQEIQLELIRRASFNALDGEKVYASLLRNRGLWRVCLLDRLSRDTFQDLVLAWQTGCDCVPRVLLRSQDLFVARG